MLSQWCRPLFISPCGLVFIFRLLLKSLLQYQTLTEGDIPPTPNSSCHPPVPPLALTPAPAGAPGLSGGANLLSVVTSGEDGALKKPKKERKERGRENGKEDCECRFHHLNICEKGQEVSRSGTFGGSPEVPAHALRNAHTSILLHPR